MPRGRPRNVYGECRDCNSVMNNMNSGVVSREYDICFPCFERRSDAVRSLRTSFRLGMRATEKKKKNMINRKDRLCD